MSNSIKQHNNIFKALLLETIRAESIKFFRYSNFRKILVENQNNEFQDNKDLYDLSYERYNIDYFDFQQFFKKETTFTVIEIKSLLTSCDTNLGFYKNQIEDLKKEIEEIFFGKQIIYSSELFNILLSKLISYYEINPNKCLKTLFFNFINSFLKVNENSVYGFLDRFNEISSYLFSGKYKETNIDFYSFEEAIKDIKIHEMDVEDFKFNLNRLHHLVYNKKIFDLFLSNLIDNTRGKGTPCSSDVKRTLKYEFLKSIIFNKNISLVRTYEDYLKDEDVSRMVEKDPSLLNKEPYWCLGHYSNGKEIDTDNLYELFLNFYRQIQSINISSLI